MITVMQPTVNKPWLNMHRQPSGQRNRLPAVVLLASIMLLCLTMVNTVLASSRVDRSWQFRVYLDGDEIGFHHFSLRNRQQHQEIVSSARFDVKFLFLNVYSYRHDNIESWQGECLASINAVTNDNGEEYIVTGVADENAFVVSTGAARNRYAPCIKTFAYWDPAFLEESRLLNSQTGEMIEVSSEFVGSENINHRGEEITARRYRLSGDELQIDLWYSDDDHWLALQSQTEDGHVIRYAMP
jgi:hypothetical protein